MAGTCKETKHENASPPVKEEPPQEQAATAMAAMGAATAAILAAASEPAQQPVMLPTNVMQGPNLGDTTPARPVPS